MSIEWIIGIIISGIGIYVKNQIDLTNIKKDIEMDNKLTKQQFDKIDTKIDTNEKKFIGSIDNVEKLNKSKFDMIETKIDNSEKKFIESIDNLEKTLSSFEKVLEKMDKNQSELTKTIVAIQLSLAKIEK